MNQSTEFGLVVFNDDVAFGVFLNERMASRHANVSDSEVIIVTSANFDGLFLIEVDYM